MAQGKTLGFPLPSRTINSSQPVLAPFLCSPCPLSPSFSLPSQWSIVGLMHRFRVAAEAFADSFYHHFLFSLSSPPPHFFPSSALLLLGITLTPHRQSSTSLVTGLSLYLFRPCLPLFLSPYGMRPRLFSYNLSPAQTQPGPSRVRGRNSWFRVLSGELVMPRACCTKCAAPQPGIKVAQVENA